MKKLFVFMLCTMFFGAPMVKGGNRIMVIADPHVYPLASIAQEADFDAYMAKQRKMIDLSEPLWHALMDTALRYRPSLVLIPGDLTRDGELAAHDTVAAALNRLQQAGIRTLVIPGNHDMPGSTWETLYWGTYENAVKDPNSHSYAVEPLRGVTVIGIDGSNGNAGTGKLKPATLQFILAQADSAVAKGHTIIAMAHWQILEHFDKQGSLESSCRFENADALRDSLMAHGVHLVLTGHFHVNGITTWKNENNLNDSIVEISTGSPITYPCPYRWLTLSDDCADMTVSTDYITSVDTIADLETYSREWMREHTYNLIPVLAPRIWNKADAYKDKIVGQYGSYVKILCGFLGDLGAEIDNAMPSTDSAKIDLLQRHMGSAVVDMYLFHSEANENERPELGDSLSQAIFDGMTNMVTEVIINSEVLSCMSELLLPMVKLMAQEPIQSLVEDITCKGSGNEDRTDDLRPTFHLNAPQPFDAIQDVSEEQTTYRKCIRDGQFLILRGEQIYNASGQRIAQ